MGLLDDVHPASVPGVPDDYVAVQAAGRDDFEEAVIEDHGNSRGMGIAVSVLATLEPAQVDHC